MSYSDETFLKEIWINWQEKYGWYHILFRLIPFFSPYCMNWPEMLRPPSLFLWKAREKGSFLSSVFFCNQTHKIHSILQFFTGSFAVDLGAFGPFWGSFAFVGSFAVGDHLRYSADTSIKRTRNELTIVVLDYFLEILTEVSRSRY